MILAVAVTSVVEVLVAVLRIERDHTEAVREHLVWEDGGVVLDFDEVQRYGGHFGEHGAAERVREGEVDGAETEVDAVWLDLRAGWG